MRHRLWSSIALAGTLAVGIAAPAGAAEPPPPAPAFDVLTAGLHNPRGLAFGEGGRLYVAEAGQGDGTGAGIGYTGSVTEIRGARGNHPTSHRVITNLLSLADEEGAVGLDGISFRDGRLYGIMGLSARGIGQGQGNIGRLVRFDRRGARPIANVGNFDYQWSLDHPTLGTEFPNSNPYGLFVDRDGTAYVADAGTNVLTQVDRKGRMRVVAYFPPSVANDSTPTCVAKGPDGALYVGTLSLVDSFAAPSAKVYRVDLRNGRREHRMNYPDPLTVATVWAEGLYPINGCAFGRNGDFYATQLFTSVTMGPNGPIPGPGDVVKIPWGHPDQHVSLTGSTLPFPGGVAVGRDGTVYAVGGAVSNDGTVVRLRSK